MAKAKPTEKQFREALRAAVVGLRSLRGMTGTVQTRTKQIDSVGYLVCGALGLKFPSYLPLEDADRLLREGTELVDITPCTCGHSKEAHGGDPNYPAATDCSECKCISYEAALEDEV